MMSVEMCRRAKLPRYHQGSRIGHTQMGERWLGATVYYFSLFLFLHSLCSSDYSFFSSDSDLRTINDLSRVTVVTIPPKSDQLALSSIDVGYLGRAAISQFKCAGFYKISFLLGGRDITIFAKLIFETICKIMQTFGSLPFNCLKGKACPVKWLSLCSR